MSCPDPVIEEEVFLVLGQLGGAESLSLIDWPGKVSMVLFFSGCNFRCPWCHNKELIPFMVAAGNEGSPGRIGQGKGHDGSQDGLPSESPVLSRGRYWAERIMEWKELCDAAVLSGGEATCQKGLGKVVAWLKGLGLKVKLDTNGSRPRVLGDLFSQSGTCPDMVAMDIKAPLSGPDGAVDPAPYARAAGIPVNIADIQESIQILADASSRGLCTAVWRSTWLEWFSEETRALIQLSLPPDAGWTRQPLIFRSQEK